jgi:putative transposase
VQCDARALFKVTRLEVGQGGGQRSTVTKPSAFKWFRTNPEIIRLSAMLCVSFPLSMRNAEDLLQERDVEISHETGRF